MLLGAKPRIVSSLSTVASIFHMADQPLQFSPRHRFADWPNSAIPLVASDVYTIWHGDSLVYFGMSGREIERVRQEGNRKEYRLVTRLRSHWSGRLSGDQFCVCVANRLVIPSLRSKHFPGFAKGTPTLGG